MNALPSSLDKDDEYSKFRRGTTAVVAFIQTAKEDSGKIEEIFVANAGDSRCVLSHGGIVIDMSIDHKPDLVKEKFRILSAGGIVYDKRVKGDLAMSRAIGDFEYKTNDHLPAELQMVTAFPDVRKRRLESDDEFLVLASDGIWECLRSQSVVDFVRWSVANGKELTEISEDLTEKCLAPGDGSRFGLDNKAVCIVALLNGRSKAEWYETIKNKVDQHQWNYTKEDFVPVFY